MRASAPKKFRNGVLRCSFEWKDAKGLRQMFQAVTHCCALEHEHKNRHVCMCGIGTLRQRGSRAKLLAMIDETLQHGEGQAVEVLKHALEDEDHPSWCGVLGKGLCKKCQAKFDGAVAEERSQTQQLQTVRQPKEGQG